jgi:hypothetical protein
VALLAAPYDDDRGYVHDESLGTKDAARAAGRGQRTIAISGEGFRGDGLAVPLGVESEYPAGSENEMVDIPAPDLEVVDEAVDVTPTTGGFKAVSSVLLSPLAVQARRMTRGSKHEVRETCERGNQEAVNGTQCVAVHEHGCAQPTEDE